MLASRVSRTAAVSRRQLASNGKLAPPWPSGQPLSYGLKSSTSTRSIHMRPSQQVYMAQNLRQAAMSLHCGWSPSMATSTPNSTVFLKPRQILAGFYERIITPRWRNAYAQWWTTASLGSAINSTGKTAARSLFRGSRPSAASSIHQGLSFPARMALSSRFPFSLHQPRLFFPHPPPVSVTHTIGLGAVRNFCVARPVFESFADAMAENVPIAARALYEAEWDLKKKKRVAVMRLRKPINTTTASVMNKRKEVMTVKNLSSRLDSSQDKEKENFPVVLPREIRTVSGWELNEFFQAPHVPNVMTYLLVPLVPPSTTTASRTISIEDHSDSDHAGEARWSRAPLLPFPKLGKLHVAHEMHSLRVSSLFTRLDASNVWARGAQLSAFSHCEQGRNEEYNRGVCTVLKVEFDGWTEAEVRSVIGESGSGWCILWEEKRRVKGKNSSLEEEEREEEMSLCLTPELESDDDGDEVDPAQALFMPTIDVTDFSSFRSHNPAMPSPPPMMGAASTATGTVPDWEMDPWLDCGSDYDSISES